MITNASFEICRHADVNGEWTQGICRYDLAHYASAKTRLRKAYVAAHLSVSMLFRLGRAEFWLETVSASKASLASLLLPGREEYGSDDSIDRHIPNALGQS
jgi:hypothetical protein